jgi:hypothetical protein
MDNEYRERKSSLQIDWIKSKQSGISYLCPAGAIRDKANATDELLQAVCIDESKNPHNA